MGGIPVKSFFKYSRINRKGFTLVELLVSATIGLLCIVAIVAMLRKGREIDINDRYRRLARSIIAAEFEAPLFDLGHTPYDTLKTKIGSSERDRTVTIDNITGPLTVTIGAENTFPAYDGDALVYIPVTITVSWITKDGNNDAITLTKQIANAQ